MPDKIVALHQLGINLSFSSGKVVIEANRIVSQWAHNLVKKGFYEIVLVIWNVIGIGRIWQAVVECQLCGGDQSQSRRSRRNKWSYGNRGHGQCIDFKSTCRNLRAAGALLPDC